MTDSPQYLMPSKRERGRQSLYTPELAAYICEQVAVGRSLVSITREPGVPSYQTIMEWLKAHPDFEVTYRQARQDQADTLAEEIIAIADGVKTSDPQTAQRSTRHGCASMRGNGWPRSLSPRSTATALKRR